MDLIEEAKRKLGSYRAVAKYLGVHETMISAIRAGKRPLPPYQAGKLAELLEMNPAQAIVETIIKAAEGKDEAANWKRWFAKVAAITVAAFVVVGGSGSWLPIFHSASANEKQRKDASALHPESSMRPTYRRTATRRRKYWKWLRSQSVIRDARRRGCRTYRRRARPNCVNRSNALG